MSGGTKTTTQKTESKTDPFAPAIPSLQKIIDKGNAAFDSGVGSQVYGGQRVAGLGETTTAGLDRMKAAAGGTTGATQAGIGLVGDLVKSGGSTAATQGALSGLMGVQGVDTSGVASAASRMADPNSTSATVGKGLASGAYALDGSGYAGLLGDVGSTTQTQRSLQDVADGKYLGGANPFLDDIIGRGEAEAASSVGQKFAASGRYGSGRFAAATADAVANVGTQARYQDYENERTRQAQAATAIDSTSNALSGIRSGLLGEMNNVRSGNAAQAVTGAGLSSDADAAALTGASALASVEQSNNAQSLAQAGTALTAAQGDRSAALGSLSQLAGLEDLLLTPGRTVAGIGAVEDEKAQQMLAADQDKFNETQAQPWNQIGLLSQLALPVAASGNTSSGTTTVKQPQPSLLQQLLGGGLAIAGTASKFYSPT
jgi:hypothetical protein